MHWSTPYAAILVITINFPPPGFSQCQTWARTWEALSWWKGQIHPQRTEEQPKCRLHLAGGGATCRLQLAGGGATCRLCLANGDWPKCRLHITDWGLTCRLPSPSWPGSRGATYMPFFTFYCSCLALLRNNKFIYSVIKSKSLREKKCSIHFI